MISDIDETSDLPQDEEKTSIITETILATKCTILIGLCVLSFFANLVLMITIIKQKLYRYSASRLIFSLTSSNLVANISVVPLMIYATITQRWIFGEIGCKITGFLTHTIGYTSILTLCMLSIDRYQSISQPFYYKTSRNRTSVNVMLVWSWSQSILAAMPPLFNVGARYEYIPEVNICLIFWDGNVIYTTCVFISCIVVPTFPMVWCYWKIFKIARKTQKEKDDPKVIPTKGQLYRPIPYNTSLPQLSTIQFNPSAKEPFAEISKLISYNHIHPNRRFTFSPQRWVSDPSITDSQLSYESNQDMTFFSRPPSTIFSDFSGSMAALQSNQSSGKFSPITKKKVTLDDIKYALKSWKVSSDSKRTKGLFPTGSPSRTIRTLIVILMSYLLTSGPYATFILIRGYSDSTVIPEWYTVMAVYLLLVSYFIHPLVYGFYSKTTRKEAYKAIVFTDTFAKLFPTWYHAAKKKRQTKRVMKKITKNNTKPIFYGVEDCEEKYKQYESDETNIEENLKRVRKRLQSQAYIDVNKQFPYGGSKDGATSNESRRYSNPF